MWGMHAQILHAQVLKSLHANHPGVTRTQLHKASFGGLDKTNKLKNWANLVKFTRPIQLQHLHPWIWPDILWKRIHVDFAGPYLGYMFFIVVDTHSKWSEVEVMSITTNETTIEVLRSLFAHHGLPEQSIHLYRIQTISRRLSY